MSKGKASICYIFAPSTVVKIQVIGQDEFCKWSKVKIFCLNSFIDSEPN